MKTTQIDDAIARVEDEQTEVESLRRGFERFERAVRERSPATARARQQGTQTTASATVPIAKTVAGPTGEDRCRAVCAQFVEHVRPHVVSVPEEEAVLETIREELGEEIALALAPATGAGFTEALKGEILSATAQRRAELDAMTRALETEVASLRSAREEVSAMRRWFESADERPLLSLGFDELRRRHERLGEFRQRCARILERRQRHLQATTGSDAAVGLTHQSLVEYLYGSLPSGHPVLSTVVRAVRYCREYQRAIRDHLTRRV